MLLLFSLFLMIFGRLLLLKISEVNKWNHHVFLAQFFELMLVL